MFHLGSVRFSLAWDPMSPVSKERIELVALYKSRGCLGCFSKPLVIISMGEADASKGLSTQAQNMNKDNRSEDFWSSSAIELDHGANQSQRSVSSIAMSNHPSSDPQSSEGIQTDPPEFVNHGLLLWNQTRQQWVGNRRSERQTQAGEPKIRIYYVPQLERHLREPTRDQQAFSSAHSSWRNG
ncbi:uncharacterized protein [Cicer arietinum]|uniref:Uncharacterized protein LOC101496661 isoform X2 n=1 Tax=Cicer arietinum TaxID=3827 RepID=A0A1S3E6V4_CICAR|nr:uncharacterized protein LOC101496661 isoform X2 [Cicer arietinum]